MIQIPLTRRHLLMAAAALTFARPAMAQAPAIHVVKDVNCECCNAWVKILKADGFAVTVEASLGVALMRYKSEHGIPRDMISCHTGRIDGYMIEGHVPPSDIRRLLAERTDAIGLAVPGMPYGSPGMGAESKRKAYEVRLILRDGKTEVFNRYEAA